MNLDNVVQIQTIREISAVDGGPSIMDVVFNDTDHADRILERLFVNDTVRVIDAEWRVWDIDGRKITLLRLEK